MVEIGCLATMLLCFGKWYDRAGKADVPINFKIEVSGLRLYKDR
jgi:hypothetical protein